MKIHLTIKIIKKLFDHGYVAIPINKVDFKSALLLLNIQNNDDRFLIYKDLTGDEIGGMFDVSEKNGKTQLFLKDITSFLIQTVDENEVNPKPNLKNNKNRYLAEVGGVHVGNERIFKKKQIKVVSIGKPFLLKQKLSDIPDWLYEKLINLEVCWVYFEYINTQINIRKQILDCVQYFKQHGEKTRKKALLHAESPGNINLLRYCDLRRIDQDMKVFFVQTENYIWLLEQNRNDPIPNIKLNNINYGGWVLSKVSNGHMLDRLKELDDILKKSPDLYWNAVN